MTITAEQARAFFIYYPETGNLYHKVTRRGVQVGQKAGSLKKDGYIHVKFRGVEYYAHRLAWLITYGEFPELLDHIDRDRSNNRLSNLRSATHAQNAANSAARRDSRSGVKGVRANRNRWIASISIGGQYKHLGSFATIEEASAAYKAAAVQQHKEFARA